MENIRRKSCCYFVFVAVLVLLSAVCRYKGKEFDYDNSDATWHTLLTMEAYNQTPASTHLFLPIVSLGKKMDKGIPWGATVPDKAGNYYYTSFSPAGYILPWMFIKILGLPVSEKSLYIFNTVLFAASALLWMYLLTLVYKKSRFRDPLCLTGGVAYVMAPELLHGMGVVYWHQSVMQVTLLLQIIMYYRYAVLKEEKYKYTFYVLALVNPYIEWTGYVANVGFAAAEMICNWKYGFKTVVQKTMVLGVITAGSFALFSFHYLLRIDTMDFLRALKYRFMARGTAADGALTDVFGGYYKSFLYIWLMLLILTVWCFIENQRLEISNGILIMVMVFPVLENIIMKQHALLYTYDRMKAVFVLIFLVCETARNILEHGDRKKKRIAVIWAAAVICSWLNFSHYLRHSMWLADYKLKLPTSKMGFAP